MSNISINFEKRREVIDGKEYPIIKAMEYDMVALLPDNNGLREGGKNDVQR